MTSVENEADALLLDLHAHLLVQLVNGGVSEVELAAPEAVVHACNIEHRGLACTRRSHDGDKLPVFDFGVNAAKHEGIRRSVFRVLFYVSESDHTAVVLVLKRVRFRAYFHYTGIEEKDGAVGVTGIARVVGGAADCSAAEVEFAEQVHDSFAIGGVEISGGLLRQQKCRFPLQGRERCRAAGDESG